MPKQKDRRRKQKQRRGNSGTGPIKHATRNRGPQVAKSKSSQRYRVDGEEFDTNSELGAAQNAPGNKPNERSARNDRGPERNAGRGRSTKNIARGRVVKNARGFAFVVLDPPLPGVREDIFLDASEAASLLSNDLVEISYETDRRSGKRSGQLIEVLERGLDTAVGEYKMGSYGPCVELLGKGMEFTAPLDERSKNFEATPGSAVLVRLHYEHSFSEHPTAEIIRVLGQSLDHSTDDAYILAKYKLNPEFPRSVQNAAEAIPTKIDPKDLEYRSDFRKLAFITIDGPTAKDFDDAVYAEELESGGTLLYVAVADVGHYVQLNDPLDQEALKRGNSTYFPTMVVPMLPERLSNGICSLNPREDRLVLVAEMEFDEDGQKIRQDFHEAVIHSQRRCTYEEIQQYYDKRGDADFSADVAKNLRALHRIYKHLRQTRTDRGSIDLDIPETQVVVASGGEVKGLRKAERWDSHRLIEECMLAANEAVAEFLSANNFPVIYRVHETPEAEAIGKFCEVARGLGANVHREGHNWNLMYQGFLDTIRGLPSQKVLNFLLLRSMKQAAYSAANLGHFALASDAYAHFTSPIRRYPDLILHRLLKAWLKGTRQRQRPNPPFTAGKVEEWAQHCSKRERHSMDAEREMIRIKQVRFAEKYVGEEFVGTVISMNAKGLFIELEEISIEGFLEIDQLGYGFTFSERQVMFRASRSGKRILLGDKLRVVISRTNPHLQRIDLDPAEKAIAQDRGLDEGEVSQSRGSALDYAARRERGSHENRADNSRSRRGGAPPRRRFPDRNAPAAAPPSRKQTWLAKGENTGRGPLAFLSRVEKLKSANPDVKESSSPRTSRSGEERAPTRRSSKNRRRR